MVKKTNKESSNKLVLWMVEYDKNYSMAMNFLSSMLWCFMMIAIIWSIPIEIDINITIDIRIDIYIGIDTNINIEIWLYLYDN